MQINATIAENHIYDFMSINIESDRTNKMSRPKSSVCVCIFFANWQVIKNIIHI